MAFKYGEQGERATLMLARLIRSPLFLAFATAIGMSMMSLRLPNAVNRFLDEVGRMTSPLILIALGIFFR